MKRDQTKKYLAIMLGLILSIVLWSCTKNDPENGEQDDDFNPKFENSNYGHYSGVLVGSTGYFNLFVTNSGIKVVVVFDDERYELQSPTPVGEKQNMNNILITDGSIKFTFSVDKTGNDPTVDVVIPGHPEVKATIAKTEKDQEVRNYLGWSVSTYQNETASYTYNMSCKGNNYEALIKSIDGTTSEIQLGTLKWEQNKVHIIAPETTIIANMDPVTGIISYQESDGTGYSLEIRLYPQGQLINNDGAINEEDDSQSNSPAPDPGGH